MTLIKKKKYTQRYLIDSKKCLSQFKTKLFWFFAICFLLFGFFWYYVSAFCAVYQKSQTSWFECSVISFVFCLVIQSFYSFVILTLRLIGLKCHCSCIYTISKYLIWILCVILWYIMLILYLYYYMKLYFICVIKWTCKKYIFI